MASLDRAGQSIMIVRPVTLEGQFIRLEPLGMEHRPALCAVAFDEDIWRWATVSMQTPDEMRRYIETALRWQREGSALPFAITLQRTGQAVGSTRFANIDTSNRRLEIGWTWLARPWQRTAANTEAKYLLLSHASRSWAPFASSSRRTRTTHSPAAHFSGSALEKRGPSEATCCWKPAGSGIPCTTASSRPNGPR